MLEKMLADGYVLGGEQSGHAILLNHNTTGYGLITAIQVISAMVKAKYEDKGRLVARASGAEALVRAMIEGPDQQEMDKDVYALSKLIEKKWNNAETGLQALAAPF